jgi:drug/metabolite transporter (DMT)-like permease
VGLTEVLFAVLFAWLLLDQELTVPQGVGFVLVLVGIALVRIDEPARADVVPDELPDEPAWETEPSRT